MTVSVVIPTHNRAQWLGRALDSVLSQTEPPEEVLVVDDGSTDDTQGLVRTGFPWVRYLHQSNRGVSAARNRGIQAAQGEWIAMLDSDDQWLPRKLECQRQALRQNPEYRFCHSDEIWVRRGRRVNPMKKHAKPSGHVFRQCLPMCVISPSAAVLHRAVFEDVGGFDETLPACEDYDLWLRIAARYPVLLVDQALVVKHGGHDDQLSRRYWGMDRFRIQALEKILESGKLSVADRWATLQTLVEKLEILAQGAQKRHRSVAAAEYREKMQRYQGMLG